LLHRPDMSSSYLEGELFFFQAEDGIRDFHVTGVQTCALPISTASTAAAKAAHSSSLAKFRTRTAGISLFSTARRLSRVRGASSIFFQVPVAGITDTPEFKETSLPIVTSRSCGEAT